ncbi:MAG TPA: hypothetical protein VF765_01355 [Polyangiaceae bacterium]
MRLQALLLSIAFIACSSSSGGSHASDAGADVEGADGADGSSGSSGGSGSGGDDSGGGSGSSGGSMLPDSSMPPCNLTLQGALSEAFPCTVTLEYFTSSNRTAFTISVADPRPLQLISITLQRTGRTMSGTWTNTDPMASGSVIVQGPADDAGFPEWQATSGSQDGGSQSQYDLQLMVGVGKPNPTGETFGSTGTFTATLVPQVSTGATGNLMLHVSF